MLEHISAALISISKLDAHGERGEPAHRSKKVQPSSGRLILLREARRISGDNSGDNASGNCPERGNAPLYLCQCRRFPLHRGLTHTPTTDSLSEDVLFGVKHVGAVELTEIGGSSFLSCTVSPQLVVESADAIHSVCGLHLSRLREENR